MKKAVKMIVCDSLQKVFLQGDPDVEQLSYGSMFENEIYSCSIAFRFEEPFCGKCVCSYKLMGPLAPYITVRNVGHVPSMLPAYCDTGEDYISVLPGLFPDPLEPLRSMRPFTKGNS